MAQAQTKAWRGGLFIPCYEIRGVIRSKQEDGEKLYVVVRDLRIHTYHTLDVTRYKRITKHDVCKIVSKILKVKEENVRLAKHLKEVL